jgi:hypothetical protein
VIYIERFECEDAYEAEKLSGFLSKQKGDSSYIKGIAAVVKNEVVITINDKSSHSIVLRDDDSAMKLKTFLEGIINGKRQVCQGSHEGSTLNIVYDTLGVN